MPAGRFTMLRSAMPGVVAVEAVSSHSFARHTHEQFGIGVIRAGAQVSASGRGMVEAVAGDTITVNPGEVHDGAPYGGADRSWRMLYVDPGVVASMFGDITEGRHDGGEMTSPVMRDPRIAGRVESLFAAVTSAAAPASRSDELLLTLLPLVFVRGRLSPARPDTAAIRRARDLLDGDPATAWTLADLAKASGLSRFQVLRGFARVTGLTPHAYLMQRRIDLARGLIAQGVRLSEAAFASGFADQSHMTRVFVGKYGLTPKAYADALN